MVQRVTIDRSTKGSRALHVGRVRLNDTADAHTLGLGTQDLIRLAGYAQDQGFKVAGFDISDWHLTPLGREEVQTVSDSMVSIISQYGARELNAAIRDDFAGMRIVGVKLIDGKSGRRMEIRRKGFIETSQVDMAEKLMTSAWKELMLS